MLAAITRYPSSRSGRNPSRIRLRNDADKRRRRKFCRPSDRRGASGLAHDSIGGEISPSDSGRVGSFATLGAFIECRPRGTQTIAEHRSTCVGGLVALGSWCARVGGRRQFPFIVRVAGCSAALTFQSNRDYRGERTLWRDTVEKMGRRSPVRIIISAKELLLAGRAPSPRMNSRRQCDIKTRLRQGA